MGRPKLTRRVDDEGRTFAVFSKGAGSFSVRVIDDERDVPATTNDADSEVQRHVKHVACRVPEPVLSENSAEPRARPHRCVRGNDPGHRPLAVCGSRDSRRAHGVASHGPVRGRPFSSCSMSATDGSMALAEWTANVPGRAGWSVAVRGLLSRRGP